MCDKVIIRKITVCIGRCYQTSAKRWITLHFALIPLDCPICPKVTNNPIISSQSRNSTEGNGKFETKFASRHEILSAIDTDSNRSRVICFTYSCRPPQTAQQIWGRELHPRPAFGPLFVHTLHCLILDTVSMPNGRSVRFQYMTSAESNTQCAILLLLITNEYY